MSALQLQRELDVNYRTAWSMGHRIRAAMKENIKLLCGIVEVDETYIGGLDKNKHYKDRKGPRGPSGKIPVIGAVERNGKVVARVLDKVNQQSVNEFVRMAVSTDISLLASDESKAYKNLSWTHRPHMQVNHSKYEYVVGAVHTNTIEGFWGLFKRGIMGSFHKVSKKYLPLYVAEFQFRYNARHEQGSMFDMVLRTCG